MFWLHCAAHGILVPQPGVEPTPPAVEAQCPNHWTTREDPLRGFLKVKVAQSCLTLCNPTDCTIHGTILARILEWVAYSLLQGIFPTQGSNPGLPHCERILYHLSHKGNSRMLEWVAFPFSRGSSWLSNWIRVFFIEGRFLTSWATKEAKTHFLTVH